MISQRVIKKPKKLYLCSVCEQRIIGPHIYAYGGEEFTINHQPYGIRICASCALSESVVYELRVFSEKELLPILVEKIEDVFNDLIDGMKRRREVEI